MSNVLDIVLVADVDLTPVSSDWLHVEEVPSPASCGGLRCFHCYTTVLLPRVLRSSFVIKRISKLIADYLYVTGHCSKKATIRCCNYI